MRKLLLILALALCPLAKADHKEDYVDNVKAYALDVKEEYNIPPSVTIAVSIYESNYGQSQLAKKYHNYFGLKATNKVESVLMVTRDYGRRVMARFMKFDSQKEGFLGFGEFLQKSHYKKAHKQENGIDFVREMLKAGYCPDRDYLKNISVIINRHELEKIDLASNVKKFEFRVLYCNNSHANRVNQVSN